MGFGLSNGSGGEMFASEKQVRAQSLSRQSPVPLDSFSLPDSNGRPVDLKTFKGKALLIITTPSMPVFGKCTRDIMTVDSRWWPFPPTILGSRSRARIRAMGAPDRRTDQSDFKQNCVPTGSPPGSGASSGCAAHKFDGSPRPPRPIIPCRWRRISWPKQLSPQARTRPGAPTSRTC